MNYSVEESYQNWRSIKRLFELGGTFSPDILHMILGTLTFIALYFFLGRTGRAAILAFFIVFIAQTTNEAIDTFFSLTQKGDIQVRNTIRDYFSTLLIPFILGTFLLTRYGRLLGWRKIHRPRQKHRRNRRNNRP